MQKQTISTAIITMHVVARVVKHHLVQSANVVRLHVAVCIHTVRSTAVRVTVTSTLLPIRTAIRQQDGANTGSTSKASTPVNKQQTGGRGASAQDMPSTSIAEVSEGTAERQAASTAGIGPDAMAKANPVVLIHGIGRASNSTMGTAAGTSGTVGSTAPIGEGAGTGSGNGTIGIATQSSISITAISQRRRSTVTVGRHLLLHSTPVLVQ